MKAQFEDFLLNDTKKVRKESKVAKTKDKTKNDLEQKTMKFKAKFDENLPNEPKKVREESEKISKDLRKLRRLLDLDPNEELHLTQEEEEEKYGE